MSAYIFFFFLSLCVEVGYEKRLKRCAKPISWLCGRSAGCQQSPIYLLPPLPGHYTLGNIHLWMHGGQRLVYLLNNLGCGVAFSVMRRGRLTVRRPWVGVHSPRVFFTIPASLLASHYTPARRTGRNAQMPFVYSSVGLRAHMQIYTHGHTNTRTLQTIFSQTNWLLHAFMIYTPPPPQFNFHVDETEFTV